MHAEMQALFWEMRLFEAGKTSLRGDPYLLCINVLRHTDTEIEVRGLDKPISPAEWLAIQRRLLSFEDRRIQTVWMERHGKMRAYDRDGGQFKRRPRAGHGE